MTRLVLASSSAHRRALLCRLGVPFTTKASMIDETRLPAESPDAMVRRLARAKAQAVAEPGMLVIGSDQCAVQDDKIVGKPNSHEQAAAQLRFWSGRAVTFLTSLCLLDFDRDQAQIDVVPYTVYFRELTDDEIEIYLRTEQPYDCAGSFKSEGLGVVLFSRMVGDDPSALIGLPLIRLCDMLANAGYPVLGRMDPTSIMHRPLTRNSDR